MTKKMTWIVILVLVAIGVFAMGMRRASMMSGSGSNLELAAVSADGKQILPSGNVNPVSGEMPKNTVTQESGGLIVSFTLNPYPPRAGQPSDFDVTLTDVNGQAVDDASISLDLTMPSMWMPPNQLTAEFVSDGKYHATGQFTMRGGWRIEVLIARGAETQSVFFDLGL
jgi:hypothetical protein